MSKSRWIKPLGLLFAVQWLGTTAWLHLAIAANAQTAIDIPVTAVEAAPPAPEPAPVIVESAPSAAPEVDLPAPSVAAPEPSVVAPEPSVVVVESAPNPAPNLPGPTPKPVVVEAEPLAVDPQPVIVESPGSPVILSERSTGCQAMIQAGQSVPAGVCPPRIVASVSSQPSRSVAVGDSSYSNVQGGVAAVGSAGGYQYGGAVSGYGQVSQYNQFPYQPKVYQGANPLKWLGTLGRGMLFPLVMPAPITSAFGWRLHPITQTWRFHTGTDIGADQGTPVVAVLDGQVKTANYLGGYGLAVVLGHNKNQQETLYAHLSEIFVRPGQTIRQGTVIGLVGSTGNSTGPHLHFEILQATPEGMVAVNPGAQLQVSVAKLVQALQAARIKPMDQS
jgi:murein DD-endopeptidase MepM/ murein hydrolase activator NlpD